MLPILSLVACNTTHAPISPYVTPSTGYPSLSNTALSYPGPTITQSSQSPDAQIEAPVPEKGLASISGVLYSYTMQTVVVGTPFYLTSAIGPDKQTVPPVLTGPEDDRGDIRGQSNDKGQFVIVGIPPGNYYLVVSTPLNLTLADVAPDNQKPRLIELAPDQQLPLGVIYLSWP